MPVLPLKLKTILNKRYEIVKVIGHGGFGITYSAHNGNLETDCVVKEFAFDKICVRDIASKTIIAFDGCEPTMEKWRAKFVIEAKNLAKIRHQAVVRVFEVWEENGTVYYAMDHIEGGELPDSSAEEWKPMAWTEAQKIAVALLKALRAVHKVGLFHGDIKPANILIDQESKLPILIDFGTARSLIKAKDKTATSMAFTAGYAPIELQDRNRSKEANSASDLYSWAMVVIGLVAKHHDYGWPIDAKTRIMLDKANVDAYSEEFLQKWLEKSLPTPIISILANCLQLNSDQRPQSASIVLDQLENLLMENLPISKPTLNSKITTVLENNFRKNKNKTNKKIKTSNSKTTIIGIIIALFAILGVYYAYVNQKCDENEYVLGNTCVSCEAGSVNEAGDNAFGSNTFCEAMICDKNERVFNNFCEPCAAGSVNEAGDDALGSNTFCEAILCAENEYVSNHICEPCVAGSVNEAGDNAFGQNTICEAILCAENEYVSNHICIPCVIDSINEAGDNASGQNTICNPAFCDENEYVSTHICTSCAAGSINEANDDASGSDTICDPILCDENEYVNTHICTSCAAGSINEANDDASGSDTICDPILCDENEYVSNHICTGCIDGLRNEVGDDASSENTSCEAIVPEGFVLIPAGSFMMGSSNERDVTITRPFYAQTHEVTQGEWEALMSNNPSGFSSCGSNCPVENVNWWEALAYANVLSTSENLQECYVLSGCENSPGNDMECSDVSLTSNCFGYRLPTEAEWEYAIRAGTTTAYYNGESTPDDIAWYNSNSNSRTHPVAQLEANSWGLYDMSGNVWEWCWDWYGSYDSSPVTDPMGADSGSNRVLRGGSWINSASNARSANRNGSAPGSRSPTFGFRLVSSAP